MQLSKGDDIWTRADVEEQGGAPGGQESSGGDDDLCNGVDGRLRGGEKERKAGAAHDRGEQANSSQELYLRGVLAGIQSRRGEEALTWNDEMTSEIVQHQSTVHGRCRRCAIVQSRSRLGYDMG